MIGYIVVTADKGLAGAYNHNVLKLAEQEMAKHKNTCLFVVGQIGRHYFVLRLFLLTLVEILVLELRCVEQYVVYGRLELFKVRLGVFKPFLGFFQI